MKSHKGASLGSASLDSSLLEAGQSCATGGLRSFDRLITCLVLRGNWQPFMISNERTSPFQRPAYRQPYHQPYAPQQPRPFVQEDTLATKEIQIERKAFFLALKENPRGRLLRITEEVGGKRNTLSLIHI